MPPGGRALAEGPALTAPPDGRVVARVLGAFEILVDGRPVADASWHRSAAQRLVKLLLVTPGHELSREAAAETLWPDTAPASSRANLRKAIHFAGRALGSDGPMVATGARLRLDPGRLDLDLDRLEAALTSIERRALELADGAGDEADATALDVVLQLGGRDLLPDDAYEDWLEGPRDRLERRWARTAMLAADVARREGASDRALEILDRVLERDPTDEAAHRLAVGILVAQGRHHAARRQADRCRRALRDLLDAEPSPATVEAFRAAEQVATPAPGPTNGDPRLVARTTELRTLEAALDRAAGGEATALSIHGATGIGKTRLLRALTANARAGGWRVVEWQALEGPANPWFAPFRLVHAGAVPPDLAAAWDEPARSAIATVCPGLGLEPSVPFADREALVGALVLAVRRIAEASPLLIAIDDLPWLDEATTDVLRRLVAGAFAGQLLLATTHRDDEPLPAAAGALLDEARRSGGLEIEVGSLDEASVEALILANLGGASVQPDIAAWAFRLSAGNPLYCLELVRLGRDRGELGLVNGRWAWGPGRRPDREVEVPETVRRLVADRTARLAGGPLELLSTAAELEPEVTLGTLEAALPDVQGGLVPALDAALDSGLVVDRGSGFAFAHPLFRLALRGAAGSARRAGTHLAIARAMSGVSQDWPAEDLARVAAAVPMAASSADHALAAAELGLSAALPMAVALGFAAAGGAVRVFDPAAGPLLERSLAAWRRLPSGVATAFDASAALTSLANLRMGSGGDAAAEAAFREAIAAARTPDELAQAYAAYWWLPYRHGDFEGCLALIDEALARLPPSAAAPRAVVERMAGWALGRLHRLDEAVDRISHAVRVLEAENDQRTLMNALDQLGMMFDATGRPDEAIDCLERSLALALELRDLRGELVRIHLGTALTRHGQAARARNHLARGLELARQMGDRYLEAVASWAAAEMEDALGDVEAARELRLRELRLLASIGGNPHNEALAHAHLANLARRAGDEASAEVEATTARRLAAASAQPGYADRIEAALGAERWSDVRAT